MYGFISHCFELILLQRTFVYVHIGLRFFSSISQSFPHLLHGSLRLSQFGRMEFRLLILLFVVVVFVSLI